MEKTGINWTSSIELRNKTELRYSHSKLKPWRAFRFNPIYFLVGLSDSWIPSIVSDSRIVSDCRIPSNSRISDSQLRIRIWNRKSRQWLLADTPGVFRILRISANRPSTNTYVYPSVVPPFILSSFLLEPFTSGKPQCGNSCVLAAMLFPMD